MSKEALKSSLQYQSSDNNYELTYQYEDAEDAWIEKKAKELGVKTSFLQRTILQVGFTRLTHYNWAGLIKEADDLFNTQACTKDKIKIKFNCHSNYKGASMDNLEKMFMKGEYLAPSSLNSAKKQDKIVC